MDGLSLEKKNGRIDLGELVLPDPKVLDRYRNEIADIKVLEVDSFKLTGVKWNDLDFTESKLKYLLFDFSKIHNCCFDACDCERWAVFNSQVADTTFRGANLRTASLGAAKWTSRNSYINVDFSEADMRGTAYSSAEFVGCVFRNTKLDKVNFQGSSFIDCVFEGELNEVIFNRKGFDAPRVAPNEMKRVDFSRAELKTVEFRELNLEDVIFPENDKHIIVNNYIETLDRILEKLNSCTDLSSKAAAGYIGVYRRWAGSNQKRGIFHKDELMKDLSADTVGLILETIEEFHR